MDKIRTLSRQIVHSNPWYRIRHDEIMFPNGKRGNYYVIEREPFCMIVAELHGKFLLVEEERYTTGTRVIEFPGGWVEPDEDPAAAALREFEEETGYRARELKPLCAPYAHVGMGNARGHLFAAVGELERVGQRLDSTEAGLKLVQLSREDILERLRSPSESSLYVLACLAAYDMFR